jgi:thymidylate kinase
MGKYILLEGIPGTGKTTFIREFRKTHDISLVDDLGNPGGLESEFKMDWNWVLEMERQKSCLAKRGRFNYIFQERGYLSVLACHWMETELGMNNSYLAIKQKFIQMIEQDFFELPDITIVFTMEVEHSKERQPATRLEMWQNPQKLELIQNFYLDYAKNPFFGESIKLVKSDNRFDQTPKWIIDANE